MFNKIMDTAQYFFNMTFIGKPSCPIPDKLLPTILSYLFKIHIEEAKSAENSPSSIARHKVVQVDKSGKKILPQLPVNNKIEARLINKYTAQFFKSKLIDVRDVLPGIEKYGAEKARNIYQDFLPIVDIIGGLENYRKLPEITWTKRPEMMKIDDLPDPVVKVKSNTSLPWIAFRTYSTYQNLKWSLGHIIKKYIYLWSSNEGWHITFGQGYPEIKMDRIKDKSVSPYNLEPAHEDEMTQDIKNPMQTLKKLFSSPVNKQASLKEGIEVNIDNKAYKMALTDIYPGFVSVSSHAIALPEEIIPQVLTHLFNIPIEVAKSEYSFSDIVGYNTVQVDKSGKKIIPELPVNNMLDARLINKYTAEFFKPDLVDVREILPGIEKYGAENARSAYREFKPVLDVLGGLEKYKKLPEITCEKSLEDMNMADLPAAVVKVKSETSLPWIAFRTFSTIFKGKYNLGHIKKKSGSDGSCDCGWYISFGTEYPEITMNRPLGRYYLEPAHEDQMTQDIKKPMQTLKRLFSAPVNKQASLKEGIEVNIKNKTYKMVLTDVYPESDRVN